nr:PREDICTED: E3 ubiquitin-protein ligase RNF213-like [Latimeria chalumnae]|eukprot:XP_014350051.1 PREDICTED: E3 ubiquitin-protein ligase RNF213-like [Latimeria chalumnae]
MEDDKDALMLSQVSLETSISELPVSDVSVLDSSCQGLTVVSNPGPSHGPQPGENISVSGTVPDAGVEDAPSLSSQGPAKSSTTRKKRNRKRKRRSRRRQCGEKGTMETKMETEADQEESLGKGMEEQNQGEVPSEDSHREASSSKEEEKAHSPEKAGASSDLSANEQAGKNEGEGANEQAGKNEGEGGGKVSEEGEAHSPEKAGTSSGLSANEQAGKGEGEGGGKAQGPKEHGEVESQTKSREKSVEGSQKDFAKKEEKTTGPSNLNSESQMQERESPGQSRTTAAESTDEGAMFTICFHAVFAKAFRFNRERDQVILVHWNGHTPLELRKFKSLGKQGYLTESYLRYDGRYIKGKRIQYQLAVLKGEHLTFEMAVRCLNISYNAKGNEWHQYEGPVLPQPSWDPVRLVQRMLGMSPDDIVALKQAAGDILLQTVFDRLSPLNCASIKTFLQHLSQFKRCYGSQDEDYQTGTEIAFGVKEVTDLIYKQVKTFLGPLVKRGPKTKALVMNPFAAGLLAFLIWNTCSLELTKADVATLCRMLLLPRPFTEEIRRNLEEIKTLFQHAEKTVIGLANRCIQEGAVEVALLIPLLRCLKEAGQLPVGAGPIEAEGNWTALEGLWYHLFRERIQQQPDQRRALLDIILEHKHLTVGDEKLPLSWFALVATEDIPEYSNVMGLVLEEVVQGLLIRLKGFKQRTASNIIRETQTEIKALGKVAAHISTAMDTEKERLAAAGLLESYLKWSSEIHGLICTFISFSDLYEVPVLSFQLAVKAAGRMITMVEKESQSEVSQDDSEKRAALQLATVQAQDHLRNWQTCALHQRLLSHSPHFRLMYSWELDMWNHLLTIDCHIEEWTVQWRKTVENDLLKRIEQIFMGWEKTLTRAADPHSYGVLSIFYKDPSQCVFSSLHFQSKQEADLLERLKPCEKLKSEKLVSKLIEESWGGYHGRGCSILECVLSHNSALHYFLLQDSFAHLELSDDGRGALEKGHSAFSTLVASLFDRTVSVAELECVLQQKKEFIRLFAKHQKVQRDELSSLQGDIRKVLLMRQEELEAVHREKEHFGVLLKMMVKVRGFVEVSDLALLESKHKADLKHKGLCELVTRRAEPSGAGKPAETICVTYFPLGQEIKHMAAAMHDLQESIVLLNFWIQQAQECWKNCTGSMEMQRPNPLQPTLQQVCQAIWEPCRRSYDNVSIKIIHGSITFKELDQTLMDIRDSCEDLRKEFAIMSKARPWPSGDWQQVRIEQIQQYCELHLAVDSAAVILKIKRELGLTGEFGDICILTKLNEDSFRNKSLDYVNKDLIRTKQLLVDITQKRKRCLEEFLAQQPFIDWVKKTLTNLSEVKVFVDLASISAGDNDSEIDRVACFYNAVMGYSSFIYKLPEDSDFKKLMDSAQEIWKALESDPDLPEKLRDSARYLGWLKTLRESHGSVETSSLSLAAAINSRGIYNVGLLRECTDKLSLENVVQLMIRSQHTEKVYTLEKLRELQNKLMLMSGKGERGKEEVDRFMEVFASIQRLGMIFIDLYTSGNMLFRKWVAQIQCSMDSEVCITVNYKIEGIDLLCAQGDVSHQLERLCRTMEACHNDWCKFMSEMRSEYYHLNYFTAKQIVYLCSELGQLATRQSLPEQVMVMLSFIQSGCSVESVRDSCSSCVKTQERFEELQEEDGPWDEVGPAEPMTSSQYHSYDILMKESQGSPAAVDRLAFECYPSSPSSDATSFDEGDQSMFQDDWKIPYIKEAYSSISLRVADDYIKKFSNCQLVELEENKLADQIATLWDHFRTNMSDFLVNHIDVVQLGQILLHLSEKSQTRVRRLFSQTLNQGRPNLIVCPEADILTTALYIYMESPEQPLPTYDEILLCSEKTSFEEAEIFLRRALSRGTEDDKVFTLIHPDRLNYETGVHFGNLFQELERTAKQDYQLVIICDTRHQHCYVPSYLSNHKIHVPLPLQVTSIQRYLRDHLYAPDFLVSAADVFPDSLCVRIVTSRRPGVGKSLYVERLQERLREMYPRTCAPLRRVKLTKPHVDENKLLQALFRQCSLQNCNVPVILHIDAAPRKHKFLDVLPQINCRPPAEVRELEKKKRNGSYVDSLDPLMDDKEFISEAIQRPYQYLKRFSRREDLNQFTYRSTIEGDHAECLHILLSYCGIKDPSWSELRNFTWFLNLQLKDCETSMFCSPILIGDTLQGFKTFIVEFMILMARDFATPSMNISDQNSVFSSPAEEEDLIPFVIRKKWETQPHPYIFFNADHLSMTFLGFHLKESFGSFHAVDHRTGKVLRENVLSQNLYSGLRRQRIQFNEDFDQLPRSEKIKKLSLVLGVQPEIDPDPTYELTADNVMKMLAIHMRFRCSIPVIIMGETGCGKTRLIKFLCDLQRGSCSTENMKLVKVHGGTSAKMIYERVRETEKLAISNKQKYDLDTILFFDEANTTEAIYAIKEILCDKTVEGRVMKQDTGLKILAACNPYRKHSPEMIKRLELAGLGYRVKAHETKDTLGKVPLRQLVYRVQPLPPSMIPLVWDFGQLSLNAEQAYTYQIVQRYILENGLMICCVRTITQVLSASQQYMRQREDECSFVSLRDVERSIKVLVWFYEHRDMLFEQSGELECVLKSLILAIGVCYYPSLVQREEYLEEICKYFPSPFNTPHAILNEIMSCQDLFLSQIKTQETIAKNKALKENVFLMIICIELKVPLFLVGKPGSSKSLAKTVVTDAMQGPAAHCDFFKCFKQVHMVSFQCSPHSSPEGIINTFRQCARFQQGRNLEEYVSVVVLDEIGLAEDSPQMPLKALHPLLEDGCLDEKALDHKKVGFIGISNWALDPAKMNRGIFVSRWDPSEAELIQTAEGICSSSSSVLQKVQHLFPALAKSYLEICRGQQGQFFGLRDYYSLVKMVFSLAKENKCEPSNDQLAEAILRNFSGKDNFSPLAVFLPSGPPFPQVNTLDMVKKNIFTDTECRYLLLLTKNYVALQILQQELEINAEIIFGSSFPKDQEYTQVCRNVNRVKICMETGRTIILLNLQNLYESLYDALNQYYVYLGGQQYVDLGLGTHRVKCRVHKKFRLIVMEDKDVVYKHFPVPLINRLEKHNLDMSTVLSPQMREMVKALEEWVKEFVTISKQYLMRNTVKLIPADAFIGFHTDACASVVLQVKNGAQDGSDNEVLKLAKQRLLKCATPDAIVRLKYTEIGGHEAKELWTEYFDNHYYPSLSHFMKNHFAREELLNYRFVEITTFSRLLTQVDVQVLENDHGLCNEDILLLSLHQFDTEYSFNERIRQFLKPRGGRKQIVLVQTDTEESLRSSELIASAKYCTMNEMSKSPGWNSYVYFVVKLSRIAGGSKYTGFQGGQWLSLHIDDLRTPEELGSDIAAFSNITISEIFARSLRHPPAELEMDVEDAEDAAEAQFAREQQMEENVVTVPVQPLALDTTLLVKTCIQTAVGQLQDGDEGSSRSTERVQMLLDLMKEGGENYKTEFLQVLKERLLQLLKQQEEQTMFLKDWMCREALKMDALQEGGTFRRTLWKCLQNVVSPNLALILAVLDQDLNLNLLASHSKEQGIKQLWISIFRDAQILKISYQAATGSGKGPQEIKVQHRLGQGPLRTSCSVPFSWLFKQYIDHLWEEARYIEGAAEDELRKTVQFVECFNKTKLGQHLDKLSQDTKEDLGFRYLQDFILMTTGISSLEQFKLYKVALASCVNELQKDCLGTVHMLSPPWIHMAATRFHTRLNNLLRILSLNTAVSMALYRNFQSVCAQNPLEMTLDVWAAFACAETIEATDIQTITQCKSWMEDVEKLHPCLHLVSDVNYLKLCKPKSQALIHQIRSRWDSVLILTVFMEYVVIGAGGIDSRLEALAVAHCSRLQKSLRLSSDLKEKETVEKIMKVLQACNEEAGNLYSR